MTKPINTTLPAPPAPPPPSAPRTPTPPPMAPTVAPQANGLPPTPPPPSAAVAPKAPPMFRPTPTRLSPDRISLEAGELNASVMSDLPTENSTIFALTLDEHLAAYWTARASIIAVSEKGEPLIDYTGLLNRVITAFKAAEAGNPPKGLAEDVYINISYSLHPERLELYAPSLKGDELLLLQTYHDLAIALICYKAALYTDDEGIRRNMLTFSNEGAEHAIKRALERFKHVRVPQFIEDYAQAIQLKILQLI